MRGLLISTLYHQWLSWSRASTGRKIFSAALTVGILTFSLSIANMGKEMVVAAFFGVGDSMDAFLIAFLPVLFIITVVAGAFTPALIPTYVRVREQQGVKAAQNLFAQAMLIAVALFSGVTAMLALSAPYFLPFLGTGFDEQKLVLTQRLFYFLLPAIIIRGIATVWSGVLNAGERFGLAALAPISVPISSMIALLVWGAGSSIDVLLVGTIVGVLLEFFLLGWRVKRSRIALIPQWHGKNSALRQVMAQYLPMVAAAAFMGGTMFVDAAMAAALDSGSVAALNYGNRIVAGITSISAGALGTAVLPFFSQLVSVGDWPTVRRLLKKYSLLILGWTIPITFLLFVVSEPLVSLFFQRGEFGESDTFLISRIQAMYGLQIPFFVLGILFVRLISAATANHILMVGSFLNLLLNVVLNYIFMQYWGVVGIALSTACVYFFSCSFLVIVSYRTLLR